MAHKVTGWEKILEQKIEKLKKEVKDVETGILGFVVGLQDNEPHIGKYLAEVAQKLSDILDEKQTMNIFEIKVGDLALIKSGDDIVYEIISVSGDEIEAIYNEGGSDIKCKRSDITSFWSKIFNKDL